MAARIVLVLLAIAALASVIVAVWRSDEEEG